MSDQQAEKEGAGQAAWVAVHRPQYLCAAVRVPVREHLCKWRDLFWHDGMLRVGLEDGG